MAVRQASNGSQQTKLQSDERELVLAFQAGDPASFQEIHERYRAIVERLCRRVLGNYHDAEEATQETFLRVYVALERFNGRYALRAWIARIATNVCLDMLRSSSRIKPHENGHADQNGDTPDMNRVNDPVEAYERDAESRRVRSILEQLPERYRAALVLREFQGLSHEEMGAVMGMTAPQVKALIHRAKRAFRAECRPGPRRAYGLMLAPFALFSWLRRLFESDFGSGAVTDGAKAAAGAPIVSSAASAATVAGSPAVASAAAAGGERIMAVVAAVTVAATATVVPAVHNRKPPTAVTRPRVAVAAPAPGASKAVPTGERSVAAAPEPRAALGAIAAQGAEGSPSPSPTPVPAGSASPSSSPSPSSSAFAGSSPSPSPSPSAPLRSEPLGFTLTFQSDVTATEYCDCKTEPTISRERLDADESGVYAFTQHAEGGSASDATGRTAWPLTFDHKSTDGRRHDMDFVLSTSEGGYRFSARGLLFERRATDWGGWVYVYQGDYEIYSHPGVGDPAGLPLRGSYRLSLSVSWRSDRIVGTSFSLTESG